jgi:hypothetical protein
MAQTAEQKAAAAALKQAQALLAKQKKSLARLESDLETLNPTPTRVDTTTLRGIQAASARPTAQELSDDMYSRNKLGTTGLTQGQIDAQTNAIAVAKSIGGTVIPNPDGPGLKVVAPTTPVVKKKDPDNPDYVPPDGDPDTVVKPKEISDATRDAFAALTDLFASYGLESLAGEIAGYMTQGLTAAEALIKLKTNPNGAYANRFAGNFTRIKQGLNALSEAEYINLESSYAKTLKAYGLGNMVSSNRQDNYKKFAEFIAADISAVEFKDRIDLAVTRVKNSDPFTRNTLKSFYNINDNDLVSYFLNPTENLPKLQQKVTAAEIGGSAVAQGLTTSLASALSLAEFGIDKTEAQAGYRYIAQALPRGSFLSDISSQGGPAYTQGFAEDVVLRKSGKALTQQEKLIEEEASRFKASSGIAGSKSLASQNRSAF